MMLELRAISARMTIFTVYLSLPWLERGTYSTSVDTYQVDILAIQTLVLADNRKGL